eukprot:13876820-Alexandrium_andersonii.AAC.1
MDECLRDAWHDSLDMGHDAAQTAGSLQEKRRAQDAAKAPKTAAAEDPSSDDGDQQDEHSNDSTN